MLMLINMVFKLKMNPSYYFLTQKNLRLFKLKQSSCVYVHLCVYSYLGSQNEFD